MKKVNSFTRMWSAALFLTVFTCGLAVVPEAQAQLIPQLPTVTSPMPGGPSDPTGPSVNPSKKPATKQTPTTQKPPALTNPLAPPVVAQPDQDDKDAARPTTYLERQFRYAKRNVIAFGKWVLSLWGMFSTLFKVAFLLVFATLRIAYYVHRQRRNEEEAELERLASAVEPEFGRIDEEPRFNLKEIAP
jgi:hypothetical protein